MAGRRRDRLPARPVLAAAWAVLVAVVLLIAARQGLLPEAPDKFTYDWRTFLFSKISEAPRDDIAIVLISEDTLQKYKYLTPVDRGLLAKLVGAVDAAGARAIGINLFLDRRTETDKDVALFKALEMTRAPVVIGAIPDGSSRLRGPLELQDEMLRRLRIRPGHLEFDFDDRQLFVDPEIVRYVPDTGKPEKPKLLAIARAVATPTGGKTGTRRLKSFARVLAELDGAVPKPANRHIAWASRHIAWLRDPSGDTDMSQVFTVLTLKSHDPSDTIEQIMPNKAWKTLLAGRIVLIGTDFIDRDQHLSPLSVKDDRKFAHVLIQAQILAQLRDGRSILEMWWPVELAALFLVAWIGFSLSRRFQLKRFDLFVSLFGIVMLIIIGFALFAQYKLIVPSATLFLAWLGGVAGGHYCEGVLRSVGLAPIDPVGSD